MRSRPGDASRTFSAPVGETRPSRSLAMADLLIDPTRFPSEGDWAFCRFDDERIPALRMGFQRGGFNIWPEARDADPDLLQLHLEIIAADGAHLWLPTGVYPAGALRSDLGTKDVRLEHGGTELLAISGWPEMTWRARTEDGELEVVLEVSASTVTVLPDCILPHAVFGMWETVGVARGRVRIGAETFDVDGSMFYDHTRVLHRDHPVPGRQRYLYTTLALEDGSALFGYDATDVTGRPIPDYCFGIVVGPSGTGRFLPTTGAAAIALDEDGLPSRWHLDWRSPDAVVTAEVSVRPTPLRRAWGSPGAPRSRAAFPIIPLVLDADVTLEDASGRRTLRGMGLAEFFDAASWAAQIPA